MTTEQQPGPHHPPQWSAAPGGPPPVGYGPPSAPQPEGTPTGKRKRSRLATIGITVAVIAGVCGIGQLITEIVNRDPLKGKGVAVTGPTTRPTLRPSWEVPRNTASGRTPVKQIRYQLESWVLASAGVPKPVSSSCENEDYNGEAPITFNCTVTYGDQKVAYVVSAGRASDFSISWKAQTKSIVVTRDGITSQLLLGFPKDRWKDLRCDKLPEVALVPVDTPMPQVCYGRLGDKKTERITIRPRHDGPPFLSNASD